MSQSEREPQQDLEHRSRRMFSAAMYRRLKAIVDTWDREERGKASAAIGSLAGLLVWALLVVVSVPYLGRDATYVFVLGFVAWLAWVVFLLRRHLAKGREGS